jgi:hypothetical protein
MADDIAAGKSGQKDGKILNNFQTSQGATFFHESFHLHWTVGNPASEYYINRLKLS